MAQKTEFTRFQQDIENNAVHIRKKQIEWEEALLVYQEQLVQIYEACPWLSKARVNDRAAKRIAEDDKARGKDSHDGRSILSYSKL